MNRARSTKTWPRRTAETALLAFAYLFAIAVTVRYTRFDGGVAFIWVAGALLYGTLVSTERERWLEMIVACWASAFAAIWFLGLGPRSAAPLALVNVGEAALAAWMTRRIGPRCLELKSMGEIGLLLATAGLVAPAIGATLGAGVAHGVAGVPYWANWLAWYAGHALGTVTLSPIVIFALGGEIDEWRRGSTTFRRLEAGALLGAMALTTATIFVQTHLPLIFLPYLPMMVMVFRLGRFGAASSTMVLAIVAGSCTLVGLGPMAAMEASEGLKAEVLQLYLATAVLMALPASGDLKRRSSALRQIGEQAALQKLILDRTGDLIMTLEPDGRIRFVSASAGRLLGISPEELVGTMPQELIHPDDIADVTEVHRQVLNEPDRTFTVEYRIVVGGRQPGWFETHARATVDTDGRPDGAVVIVRDVNTRKVMEHRLVSAAYTDPLTGVANRRAFEDALAIRLSRAGTSESSALAIFDIDHFKQVNDGHGHATGDRVLRNFADILRHGVRGGDMVARFGGEEFVAIIEGDLDAARLVCDRIRRRLEVANFVSDLGVALKVTVSAGVTPLPPSGCAAAVLAKADEALYRAKSQGRNKLVLAT